MNLKRFSPAARLALVSLFAAPLFASGKGSADSVRVTSPASGSAVTSPTTYIADAATTGCDEGIASMGIYVGNTLKYVVNGHPSILKRCVKSYGFTRTW